MQRFKDGLNSAYAKTKSAAKKAWASTKKYVNKAGSWIKRQFTSGAEMGIATAGVIITSALMF